MDTKRKWKLIYLENGRIRAVTVKNVNFSNENFVEFEAIFRDKTVSMIILRSNFLRLEELKEEEEVDD